MLNFVLIKKEIPLHILEYIMYISYEFLSKRIDFSFERNGSRITISCGINDLIYEIIMDENRKSFELNLSVGLNIGTSTYDSFEYFDNTLGQKLLEKETYTVSPYSLDLIELLLLYLPSFDSLDIKQGYIIIKRAKEILYVKDNFYAPHPKVITLKSRIIALKEFDKYFRKRVKN